MIVYMRLRPPFGSFLNCGIYREATYYPTRIGFPRPRSAETSSVSLLLEEMDQSGIRWGVVMGRKGSSVGSVPNEEIAAFVQAYSGRFVWFAGMDLSDVDESLSEVSRFIDSPGLKGFAIEPGLAVPPLYADDSRLHPLYEACEAAGRPVSVALSAMMGPDLTYSNPTRLQRVARDFPGLRIIVSHGAWPWVQEALGVAFACPNVCLSPDLYMNSFDMPGALEYARAANLYLGDRLLFGTAYPSRPLQESVSAFKRLPIRPEVQSRVLFDNAAALLGLA